MLEQQQQFCSSINIYTELIQAQLPAVLIKMVYVCHRMNTRLMSEFIIVHRTTQMKQLIAFCVGEN